MADDQRHLPHRPLPAVPPLPHRAGRAELNGDVLNSRSGISFTKKAIISTDSKSRFLLIGGKPLNEPIIQYGPFVMNTQQEIIQALRDYNIGQS